MTCDSRKIMTLENVKYVRLYWCVYYRYWKGGGGGGIINNVLDWLAKATIIPDTLGYGLSGHWKNGLRNYHWQLNPHVWLCLILKQAPPILNNHALN